MAWSPDKNAMARPMTNGTVEAAACVFAGGGGWAPGTSMADATARRYQPDDRKKKFTGRL